MRFTVVTIRRFRADYVVEAADERDAWNRVRSVESGEGIVREIGVSEVRKLEIEPERFVILAEPIQ